MCPGDKEGGADRCKVAVITGNNTNCHIVEEEVCFCVLVSDTVCVSSRGCGQTWLACVNEKLLFQTWLYLMRCLTADVDLLSNFMSCFWLLTRLVTSGSVQCCAGSGCNLTYRDTFEYSKYYKLELNKS